MPVEVGDKIEFLHDSVTEKAPSSGVIVYVKGRNVVADHSDTVEIFAWPPGEVSVSIANDGRRLWKVGAKWSK